MERRDALQQEVSSLRGELKEYRDELKEHVKEEMALLTPVIQELGTLEQIRERRIFIETWIRREQDRAKLRTAIIEKGLMIALAAIIVFSAQAVWHELVAAIKHGLETAGKK